MAASKSPGIELPIGDRVVRISNPDRVYFPTRGETKIDLVNYYISVGEGIVNALRERPCMLHRFPTGVSGEKVHQKRVPSGAPPWLGTVRLHFPRYGLHADELCVTELAEVIWAVQMSTVEFHPWNSRKADTEKPDEWRIDLDPMPECPFDTVRRIADVAHEVLDELGAVGWPKTSGGKGMHIYVRIEPSYGFTDVRRAALAFAREVERRAPGDVTTTWWRKDRDPTALFVDYNQNARDHTMAAAYSVRGVPDGRVSTPIRWDEIDDVEPAELTIATVPARFARLGDLHAAIDEAVFSIDQLLEWADRDEREGAVDAGEPDDVDESEHRFVARAIILTVDDDPAVSQAITRDLRSRYGDRYRLARATSGAEALTAMEEFARRDQPVALIVSDHRMPEMTGIELLRHSKVPAPGAKLVLLTAYADTDVAIKAINDIGLDHYLMKPWAPPEERLFPVIDDLLSDWEIINSHRFDGIRVVGNRWSERSYDTRMFLARNHMHYQWLELERDAEQRD